MAASHNGAEREGVTTQSPESRKQSLDLMRTAFILAAGWTAVIILGAGWQLLGDYENTMETAHIQASGSFEKDLVYRRWAAGHGGVYVPVSEETPPNPYLSHIENSDVTTTSGLNLTLVNPAYMTRQVHELGREQFGQQGHITSLNPLRPQNAPDAWEAEALRAFEGGETEVAELGMIGDREYLRLMRPMITEASCLKCHAAQGYEEGDLRGGISVSVPMAPLWTIMYGGMATETMGYGVIWLLGLGGIGLGASRARLRLHERDRAEQALRDSEQCYHELFSNMTSGVAVCAAVDNGNRFVFKSLNDAGRRLSKLGDMDIVGRDLAEVFPGVEEFGLLDTLKEVWRTGETTCHPVRQYKDARLTSWYENTVYRLPSGDVVAVYDDVTERQRTAEELKRRTHDLGERLKELNCLYVISKLAEQPDISAEQILQGTVDVIPSGWQYPGVATARITLEDRVYSTANFRESRWRQDAEVVVHGEPIGRVEVCYLTEKPVSDEGPFLKEERSLINAIAEHLGKTIQRIQGEEEKVELKQQLHQAQKMEAVAQLAGGVAHDFYNLLTVISGYVSLARDVLPDDHKAIESLRGVQEAAEQAGGVTSALLTFSHRTEVTKEPVELHASVEKSLRLLRHVLPAGIDVETDTPREPVWIHADGTQLQQIIMNLAINARDAMPDGGTLRFAISKSAPRTRGIAFLADPRAPVARLVVSDTGTGMEPDVRERIFEPFFTTKPRGQGTGLGLAISHSIVEDHDGNIWVESAPGKGTTFSVELPLLDVDPLPDAPVEIAPARRSRGEVVLLAEDNRHVRRILTSALGSLGYEVIQANDGAAIIDCFDRHRERIELLVIDMDLPKRSGDDCLREIRSSGGVAPAIIITATVDADLEERLDEDTTLLRKPFQIADFTALAGSLLASRRQREKQT